MKRTSSPGRRSPPARGSVPAHRSPVGAQTLAAGEPRPRRPRTGDDPARRTSTRGPGPPACAGRGGARRGSSRPSGPCGGAAEHTDRADLGRRHRLPARSGGLHRGGLGAERGVRGRPRRAPRRRAAGPCRAPPSQRAPAGVRLERERAEPRVGGCAIREDPRQAGGLLRAADRRALQHEDAHVAGGAGARTPRRARRCRRRRRSRHAPASVTDNPGVGTTTATGAPGGPPPSCCRPARRRR